MLPQLWTGYLFSFAVLLGSTSAGPLRAIYEGDKITLRTNLIPRAPSVCKPCEANAVEIIYPQVTAPTFGNWKRVCITVCKRAGSTLVLNSNTNKYDCSGSSAGCKRQDGTSCTLPKCTATQELFKGKCVPKCATGQTRNLTTGKCAKGKGTTVGTPKCTATQELFKGKCVPKCATGQTRNPTTGKCAKGTGNTGGTPKCTATQELFKGNCVPKCVGTKRRNTAGKCV